MARHRGTPGTRERQGRPGSGSARHARPPDQMYRSSLFLLASTAVTAGLGFVFWVVVANFYPARQVGLATSLISATTLIAYLSLFGLNSTLIRYPAARASRNGQLTMSLTLVAAVACLLASGYLLGLPVYGEKLLFIRDQPLLAAAFVLLCSCAAVNLLTKSVFVGARVPQYNVLVDGLLQGLAKLALPAALVGFGTAGIVGSTGGGYVVAALAAQFLLHRKLGFRFDFRTRGTRLREQLRFSVASYSASLLNLLPQMVTPLIVLHHLGAESAGYYYVAYQIATLLYAISFSVGEAVFAEASYEPSRFGVLLRRSATIMAAVQIPAAAAVALGSGLVLKLFGHGYAEHAQPLLFALAVAAGAVALNTWATFALKLTGQLRALVVCNLIYATVSIGLALYWAPRGLVWFGWAWAGGNLAAGVAALAALALGRGRPQPAAPSALPDQRSSDQEPYQQQPVGWPPVGQDWPQPDGLQGWERPGPAWEARRKRTTESWT
ncbi:O-antigen/teichoic acid export membrane protein [Kitasatospora gansuensis]|uniref:O-antigen/teichoic acid export membrane protein n=1 Tax=Kitasatospora gansuensis TaxID=258050 RepID=A0A7W7WI00_9ACTN|nr:lipopolysaccharide biosynthesis protein [Kitasatospora gansuensis]MBB4947024.1 O-antigen/teichoic acid export membrane protein [Kitasatospora gansuensis]